MTFTPARITAFALAMLVGLAATVALPTPYPADVAIERTTGKPLPSPWRTLDELRAQGDLGVLLAGLRQLRDQDGGAPVVHGLLKALGDELGPPQFDVDPQAAALIERYYTGGATHDQPDARAAVLQRRLAAGEAPPVGELLALAARFRQLGRANAQWRWLSRAFALAPSSLAAADGLVALCVANGRLEAAADIAARHTADRSRDLVWNRRLAQLGAWLGRTGLEAEALERVVALAPTPVDRGRLISLYTVLGEPERALPHAVALADGAAETAAAEEAADTALRAGFVDEGLAMLQRAAERAPIASPWLQRYADLALQDLRIPEVRQALESAAELDPENAEEALEDLYRRTDRPAELADLLQRRLATHADDARLWQELITLRSALGQRDAARLLALQRDAALADPASFAAALPEELRARAGTVRNQALSLALASGADGAVVGQTLEQLRPFLMHPAFRNLAETLLTQHPHDPRAKSMRRELVDIGRTATGAEQAAAALAASYPDDQELVRLWLERAQWADLVPAQIAARRRLATLAPDDHANRYDLADLLEFAEDRRGALAEWQSLVAAEGSSSKAVPRLIDALFALGDEEGAVEWLQRLAADPDATSAQRLLAADELFYRRSYDRARVLYAAVLQGDSNDAQALLRMGQIAAWTNDPRTARGFFARRLAATDVDAPLVRFYLGETLWALGEVGAARALHEQALAEFRAVPNPDFAARSCIATMLARLDQREAAAAAYRDLVARSPRDVDLVLDYADLALQGGELGLARALVDHATALAPQRPRVLRCAGAVAARAGDFAAADQAFDAVLATVGADASVLGDQSQLRLDAGKWSAALASAQRWREVQPDSIAAQRVATQLEELLADVGVAEFEVRRIGRDRTTSVALDGTWRLDERHWLQGQAALVAQRGVTALGSGGEASAEYTALHLAWGMRPGSTDRAVFGLSAAPGAPGDLPVGAFAAGHFAWPQDALSVDVRLRWHELWDEPMAAAALGGRQSGVDVSSLLELGRGVWTAGHVGFDLLSIDPDGSEPRSDRRLRGELALGMRLVDGDTAVTSPFDPLVAPAGPESPFLDAPPEFTRAWLANAWLGWRSARLLGDGDLTTALPLLRRDDFLVGSLRVDHHVARALGASATGYAGVDAHRGTSVYGIEAALTWRPTFGCEISLSGNHGSSLGRSDGGDVDELRCQVVWRW